MFWCLSPESPESHNTQLKFNYGPTYYELQGSIVLKFNL